MSDSITCGATHDLIIRNGTVVDGTGAPSQPADIAVDGGRIARIAPPGGLDGAGAAIVIDATGRVVTPGFVDVHTHLDAQIGWDPLMQSSSYHGVTTVLLGNCGVTFAPLSAPNRRYLAELMEAVEDIAADAIMDGLPWNWESYGEYLDTVQSLRPSLNVVGMAGHSPIRFDVMGDRSLDEGAQPTDDELARIVDIVRRSMQEGAVGFSTSRFLGHKVPDGRLTPGTWADARETSAIQRAIVEGGGRGGLFQVAPDMKSRRASEIEMFETGADLGCHVLFSGGVGPTGEGGVARMREFLERSNGAGRQITSLCHTRPSGALFGLAQLSVFSTPAWRALMALPTIADRVAALRNPVTRATLIAEGKQQGFRMPPAMLHGLGTGDSPDYDLDDSASLAALADSAGEHPVEFYVRRLLESDGRELFNLWMFGGNVGAAFQYQTIEHVIPLLGDAGAHVGQICDADSTTFLLTEQTRRGVFTVEEAIRKITSQPARLLGLRQRGEIHEGWHADLNVIDLDNLATGHPEYVYDFPHDGGRFIVRSTGYDATIVGGKVVTDHGRSTGVRPGQVIREFVRN
jgi:N-acyl-D-aspartate/D-glutamate deacylase